MLLLQGEFLPSGHDQIDDYTAMALGPLHFLHLPDSNFDSLIVDRQNLTVDRQNLTVERMTSYLFRFIEIQ
jgi:hypothetical protein